MRMRMAMTLQSNLTGMDSTMMIFKEQISPARWIGVLVIVFGVIIATRG